MTTTYDTIVIGAGQAGLAAGHHLATRGKPFLVLDSADRVGGAWLHRWDSLTLFTPSIRDSLPGFPLRSAHRFPTREEMIEYLEQYAEHFRLPIRLRTPVDGLFREDGRLRVTSGTESFLAENVILAVGPHQKPRIPECAPDLSPDIVQLHSADYRNPDQLQDGPVLVVGAGNSGAEVSVDIGHTHQVLLAGRNVGYLPIEIRGWQGRLLFPAIWWAWEHVVTERTKVGRTVQAKVMEGHGEPLIRQKEKDLLDAGVQRVPRLRGVVDGQPQTEDGTVHDVRNVIWCTGFLPDFGWLELPGLDASGRLDTERGAVRGQPGLYVLAQEFQYMFNSHTVGGVGKDAAYVVRHLDRRMKSAGRGSGAEVPGGGLAQPA